MSETAANTVNTFNYFDSIFRNAKQNKALTMNVEGIITSISPSFTAAFGYTPEDIVGKSFRILFTEEDIKKGLPENELPTDL